MQGRQVFTLVLTINRIGRHRKGDTVKLTLKQNSANEASLRLHAFCRDYLVAPRFEVFLYGDGSFDVGKDGVYGGGTWEITGGSQ